MSILRTFLIFYFLLIISFSFHAKTNTISQYSNFGSKIGMINPSNPFFNKQTLSMFCAGKWHDRFIIYYNKNYLWGYHKWSKGFKVIFGYYTNKNKYFKLEGLAFSRNVYTSRQQINAVSRSKESIINIFTKSLNGEMGVHNCVFKGPLFDIYENFENNDLDFKIDRINTALNILKDFESKQFEINTLFAKRSFDLKARFNLSESISKLSMRLAKLENNREKTNSNTKIVIKEDKESRKLAEQEKQKRIELEQRIAELEKKNKELQQPKKKQPAKPKSNSGSGFFISKLGHIITNQHVVNKCNKITIGDHIDRQVPAQLLEADRVNDLALLRTTNIKMASAETQSLIRKLSIQIVPLASGGLMRKSDVKGGEDVIVAGFPYGVMFSKEIKVTFGNVNSTKGIGNDSSQFQIQAPVQPGNSGGPIYDRYGNIVGVVVSQLNKLKLSKSIGSMPENVNFGIKASTVSQFINSSGVITNWSKRTQKVSNEKIFEIASKQTVMVVCHR